MEGFKPQKTVKLDGRIGEGGGQVVRIAVALAALTGTPLQIENVRGNRYFTLFAQPRSRITFI
jgi:RNA 3'-terminal phosphate cyclase (ATP)